MSRRSAPRAATSRLSPSRRGKIGRRFSCSARELEPGGRLVLANFCRDEAGCYMGHTGGRTMFEIPNTLWQRFVAAGVIRHDEYVRMTLSTYYRTVEECTLPLTDPGSPVYRTGLRLEQYETRVVPCPLAAAFRHHGDATRFAHEYIPSLRSWSESTFLAALSAGSTARAAPEDC